MEWLGPVADDGLNVFMQLWVETFIRVLAGLAVVGLVALAIICLPASWRAWSVAMMRRRFYCRLIGREVQVDFASRGLLPLVASVRRCSAFEDGCPTCSRRCVAAAFRKQWEPALPVFDRPFRAS